MIGLKEIIYFSMDLAGQVLRKCLVIYLIHGLLTVKDRYRKREKWVRAGFIAISTAYYLLINYLPPLKKIVYGNEQGMQGSRTSIIPMLINMLLMLLYCFYFYKGKKSKIAYPVFTACTVHELILFTLHSVFVLLMEGVSAFLAYFVMEENEFILKYFYMIFGTVQFFWNLAYQTTYLLLYYKVIKIICKNLAGIGRKLNRVQEAFLFVPGVMGFCFCILIRSIIYSYDGPQYKFLMDEYPESRLLIPMVASLSLLSVVLSTMILRKLVESSEREMLVEVYQNRISDMEEHMKDVEHLYDGIRGMRHDMKNYVADLEILMKQDGSAFEEYGEEMRRYLDGLCGTMEGLDMQCSTGNPVTDVVISRKMRKAGQENIAFENRFIFPKKLGIGAFDVSILLNNGLDNALEAAGKEENPYIRLDSYAKGNMFFIEIRNSFSGNLHLGNDGKTLLTSKENDVVHGFGLKNMQSCAEKYYGTLRWETGRKEFLLEIMLQGVEETNGKEWN